MKAKKKTGKKFACAILSLVLCIGSMTIGAGATAIGDYNNAAERDELPFYEFDYSLCPHEKLSDDVVIERYPDGDTPGLCVRKCARCGVSVDPQEIPALKIRTASLVLNDSLAINYKVRKEDLIAGGFYANPYIVFSFLGETITVRNYTEVDGYYVFVYDNISPHVMNETITSTLYATCLDQVCAGKTQEYSVATYCYNKLEQEADNVELRTLLVDLLNYGTAAQNYTGRNTSNLASAQLTDAQKAWGTATDRALTTVQDTEYILNDGAAVNWKGAGLSLQNSVALRLKIDAANVEGLYAKVVNANGEYTIPSSRFVKTEGGYYVYVDRLSVANISNASYITIYDENGPISNTLCYSAESYAYSMKSKTDSSQLLIDLINAMIRYGDSAKAYVTPDGEQPDLPDESWTKLY